MFARYAFQEDEGKVDSPDLFRQYMQDISSLPRLTDEEESELSVKAFENGDPESRRRLVLDNLQVVVKMALKYRTEGCSVLDLIQEGNMGMLVAVTRYNPYKGTRFSTYASFWIKSYILHYIMGAASLIPFGKTLGERRLFFTLQKETARLETQGVHATPAILAGRLGAREEDVVQMQARLSDKVMSLESPVIRGEETVLLRDVLRSHEDMEAAIHRKDESRVILIAVENLRPRLNNKEAFILDHRIISEEPLKLRQVGDNLGVTRERVRQIEKDVMERLRKELTKLMGRGSDRF